MEKEMEKYLIEQIKNRSPIFRSTITYKKPEITCRVLVKKRISKPSSWYASRLGEIFPIVAENDEHYYLLPDGYSMRWILKEDCREVSRFELYIRKLLKLTRQLFGNSQ